MCLLVAWSMVCLAMIKGIQSSGKVRRIFFFFLVVSAALALVTRQVSTGENHWRKDILTSRE